MHPLRQRIGKKGQRRQRLTQIVVLEAVMRVLTRAIVSAASPGGSVGSAFIGNARY